MRVLKICLNTWEKESRDQRELNVCKELEMDTVVLAKGNADDRGREEYVNGFRVYRYTTRPISNVPTLVNRIISIFQWAKYASELRADIITGHDIGGWTIGWISLLFRQKDKPLLVYDSHEFELGRNTKRNRIQIAFLKFWEKKVIEKSVFTIVVNDSIADELVDMYKLKKRPVVVRNIPDRWDIDPLICKQIRKNLERDYGEGYYILYHGMVCRNRGIEQLSRAIKGLDDVKLLIIGNPESDSYLDELNVNYFSKIKNQVFLMSAVPHDVLWKYIGAVDLSVAPIIPKYRSYYYALPNKLFESVQVGTPLLVSDLPEMRKIVKGYQIGECVDAENIEKLRDGILRMKRNGKEPYIDKIKKASEELTWDTEKKALIQAYKGIMTFKK